MLGLLMLRCQTLWSGLLTTFQASPIRKQQTLVTWKMAPQPKPLREARGFQHSSSAEQTGMRTSRGRLCQVYLRAAKGLLMRSSKSISLDDRHAIATEIFGDHWKRATSILHRPTVMDRQIESKKMLGYS